MDSNRKREPKSKPELNKAAPRAKPISLKELARQLDLSPTTLSLVLSASPLARSIPKSTQDLIFAAARRSNYRPNYVARSLRAQRTYAVGVVMPELSEGYTALVLSGIEDFLRERGYMLLATSHRRDPALIESSLTSLHDRGVEGIIAIDTPLGPAQNGLRAVTVSGYGRVPGVANVNLNHKTAARLALEHLRSLGHSAIAVIKGQRSTADAEPRLRAILTQAAALGLEIPPSRIAQLGANSPSPETGYLAARELLANGGSFTALFSFNDVSAIGAMRALRDAGLRVPEDISVVGFDDAPLAAYQTPSLTTVRQPLRRMGSIAAGILLDQIDGTRDAPEDDTQVEPELIVRESTARAVNRRSWPSHFESAGSS